MMQVAGVIETTRPDAKNAQYQSAIKHGDLLLNRLQKLSKVGTPGALPTDELGQYAYTSPKYQFYTNLGFSSGAFGFDYSWSWFDKTLRYSPDELNGNPNYVAPEYKYIKARSVHNIYASLDVNKSFQFYGGISNLFNQMPDLGLNGYPTEAVGRAFFIGAKVKY